MSEFQKVIKYLAIAFGALLIITILMGIYEAGFVLGNMINNEKNENINLSSYKIENDVSYMKIDLKTTNLEIKKGNKFKIKTDNKYIKYNDVDEKLIIKEEKRFSYRNNNKKLIVYIPNDFNYNTVVITSDVGKIDITNLITKNLYLEVGAGKATFNNLEVLDKTNINSGAGKITINNSKLSNLNLDLGVGEFNLEAEIKGKSKIEAGIGEFNLSLLDGIDNYTINTSKGIGEIKINNKKVKNNNGYGNGSNIINIDGGIGEININV